LSELFIIKVIRITLLESILIGGALIYINFLQTRNRKSRDLYDESIHSVAYQLRHPLEQTRLLFNAIRAAEPPPGISAQDLRELEEQVEKSLYLCDQLLLQLEGEELSFEKHRNFSWERECAHCEQRIGILRSYYSISELMRETHDMGSNRNDIHCSDCHAHSQGANSGMCAICAAWSPAGILTEKRLPSY
jgi:hypothetical protein